MQELSCLFKEKNEGKTQYTNLKMGIKVEIQCLLESIIWLVIFAYFFYRSYLALIILAPGMLFYRKEKLKRISIKRKNMLELQFKEILLSVQTNLQSGYSLENAFLESYAYIVNLYGESCDMAKELMWIKKGLFNGDTLEHLLQDLGRRCPESALEDFASVYTIACKTGGGWSEVISKIITGINRQVEIKQEIELLIHGKKVESRIMCIIPFFILFYMNLTSKGYFNVLYHNLAGIIIMSVCLSIYILAFLLSEKMTEF